MKSYRKTLVSITVSGALLALVVFGSSGCNSTQSRESVKSAKSESTAFWKSFEHNCSNAGLHLVKLQRPSGLAMICSRNYQSCSNWVTKKLASANVGVSDREMGAKISEACRGIPGS